MSRETAVSHLGHVGPMISPSKSGYREKNPDNIAVFNAQVCVEKGGSVEVIWNGDLDVTLSRQKLRTLAADLGTNVYVMQESEGFNSRGKINLANFVYRVTPFGKDMLGKLYESYKLA